MAADVAAIACAAGDADDAGTAGAAVAGIDGRRQAAVASRRGPCPCCFNLLAAFVSKI